MVIHLMLCALAWPMASALWTPNAREEDFQDVILILQGAPTWQMSMLDKYYSRIFREVKFMMWTSPGPAPVSAQSTGSEVELADENGPADGAWPPYGQFSQDNTEVFEPQIIRCSSRNRYVAKCLAPYLKRLVANGADNFQSLKGVLVSHVDFWFRPKEIIKLGRLDRIWQLRGGLSQLSTGPKCFSDWGSLQLDRSWSWPENGKSLSWEAAKKALKHYRGDEPLKTTVCYGWSDLYYIPVGIWDEFVEMAPAFSSTYHAVAVPTLLHMLQFHQGRKMLECSGSCCKKTAMKKEEIGWGNCGHKMDLKRPDISEAWTVMMRAYQPGGTMSLQ